MWFERLTGFAEETPEQVRANLSLEGDRLRSQVNGWAAAWGALETPSLGELRRRATGCAPPGRPALRQVVADVQALHRDPANAGALFQVASQFNLLEMASPEVTPEQGVGIYEFDRTQGPACAIACGAGTIYRNYFAPVNGQRGQSAENQIDCLAGLGAALGNEGGRLWRMQNGYALPSEAGLVEIGERLRACTPAELDDLRQRLRTGLQWQAQVTLEGCTHRVSQAYCSALPVAYSQLRAGLWEPFARLVLEAAYEATLWAACLNAARSGSRTVFLTLLGGGAFGNRLEWILAALRRAVERCPVELDMAIVSYGRPNEAVQELIEGIHR